MGPVPVIDLSHHNMATSFELARIAGVVGVIHKATEGMTFVDKKFAARRQWAAEHGLLWASYHFLRSGNIEKQMAHYLQVAQPAKGERVVIDYEHEDCELRDLIEAVDMLKAVDPTLNITVYAGHLLKQQLGSRYNPTLANHTDLWIAHYTKAVEPRWPSTTWSKWTLWQYSDGSVGGLPREVPGIKSPVDCNRFNGTEDELRKWFGASQAVEPPAPEPQRVDVRINAPEGVQIFVNGQSID